MVIENDKDRFIISRWGYGIGEYVISDVEYDKLETWFKNEYPDDIHSKQSWSFDECPVDLLKKYGLEAWIQQKTMGYMAESIRSINTESEFNQIFSTLSELSRLSYKIDGWNTRASYFNGVLSQIGTRGRTGSNMVFNNIAPLFPRTIPYKGRVSVTGELNIPDKKWEIYKSMTGNVDQRASVRTALARGDWEYLSFLAFNVFLEDYEVKEDNYKLLKSMGFKTPMFRWVDDFNSLKKNIEYMSKMEAMYGYLTDGVVIENSQYQLAIRLGKWEEQVNSSYVVGYEETQGMYGYSLEVLMRPVHVGDRTCSRVSVTNPAIVEENKLKIGSPIAFNIRSSANTVLDSTATARLQDKWRGAFDKYVEHIDELEVS